jgi:hypothetical protein
VFHVSASPQKLITKPQTKKYYKYTMTTTATAPPRNDDDATSQLVKEWEKALSSRGKDGSGSAIVPTTVQMYKLGVILHAFDKQHNASPAVTNVRQAYHQLLDSLPSKHRKSIFGELHQGMQLLIQESQLSDPLSDDSKSNIRCALECMSGLYRSSPLPAETADQPLETMASLASIYGKINNGNEKQLQSLILSLLSQFLWAPTVDWEQLLAVIDRIQQEPDVWKNLVEWETERDSDWIVKIASRYPDETQYDYLSNMLSSMTLNIDASTFVPGSYQDSILPQERQASLTPAATKPQDEIQRRIDQVRQVLPDLGEGFVETAISFFKGNVEQTLQALLDDASRWPAPLQMMDRTLPRRHRNITTAKQEEEARLVAKATLLAVARQQQQEAMAVDSVLRTAPNADEYNDDYDDQYDDTEGFGGADTGNYDDYETVRTYNRVLKGVEQEQSFWEESRNTNRGAGETKNSKETTERGFRGPDKGRGGRIPNPNAGGGRGRGRGRGRDGAGPVASKSDGDAGAPDTKKGDAKKGDAKKGDAKKGDAKKGDAKKGDAKKGDAKKGDAKKGDVDTADGNTANKPNPKQKARQLANRRDQQKRAQSKRSG